MALASVAPYTLRAIQTENLLQGRELTRDVIEEAARAIQDEIRPIDDIRSTEAYRRRVTGNLVRDFLSIAIETPSTPEGPSEHSGTSSSAGPSALDLCRSRRKPRPYGRGYALCGPSGLVFR